MNSMASQVAECGWLSSEILEILRNSGGARCDGDYGMGEGLAEGTGSCELRKRPGFGLCSSDVAYGSGRLFSAQAHTADGV